MKTNTNQNRNQKAGLPSRPEQLGTETNELMRIDLARRRVNRSLDTHSLLELLRTERPRFFEIAEVVGKWVWLQFNRPQPAKVNRLLIELGFHWNDARQTWQHPCGMFAPSGSHPSDPRVKYGSYFAADIKPA